MNEETGINAALKEYGKPFYGWCFYRKYHQGKKDKDATLLIPEGEGEQRSIEELKGIVERFYKEAR